jgi:hypothetical protein
MVDGVMVSTLINYNHPAIFPSLRIKKYAINPPIIGNIIGKYPIFESAKPIWNILPVLIKLDL